MNEHEPADPDLPVRPPRRTWLHKRSGLLVEGLLIIAAVFAIHLYQTRNLLDTDGQAAPPLSLATLAGANVNLHEDQARPALVYFFAPWCNVCAASAHNIRALRRSRDEDDLTILLVALEWTDIDEVRDYAERHELTVPVLLGDAATARDWQIFGFPTYYVLDSEHRIVRRDFGYSSHFGLWWRTRFVD